MKAVAIFLHQLAAEHLGFDRQEPALAVVEKEPASAELFEKHPILGAKVIDHPLLSPIGPAGRNQGRRLQVRVLPEITMGEGVKCAPGDWSSAVTRPFVAQWPGP